MIHRLKKYFLLPITFALVAITSCKKDDKPTPIVLPPPVINSFSPASITSDQTGYMITILGSNFNTDKASTVVKFNGVTGTVYLVTDTQIVFTFPPISPSSGKITITTGGVTLTTPTDFVINPAAPQLPQFITGVQYGSLPGAVMWLKGAYFDPVAANNTVTINGVPAVVNSADASNVYFTVPANATSGKLVLTTKGTALTYPADFIVPKGSYTTVANSAPADISFDAAGNLYGTSNNTVIKVSPTGAVTTLATIGGTSTVLNGCVADAAGNVYVSGSYDLVVNGTITTKTFTTNDLKVYKVSPAGVVTTLAGNGTSGFADGQGAAAQFIAPTALAVDASSNIYVLDSLRVRKIAPDGTVSTLAGSKVTGPAADGQGAAAVFSPTKGIVVDAQGNVYVACVNSFRKITPGGLVTTINTSYSGLAAWQPFDDLATNLRVKMAIDVDGNILVGTGSILKLDKTGTITNTYLNPGLLNGMALDATGNIFASGDVLSVTNGVVSWVPKIVKIVYK